MIFRWWHAISLRHLAIELHTLLELYPSFLFPVGYVLYHCRSRFVFFFLTCTWTSVSCKQVGVSFVKRVEWLFREGSTWSDPRPYSVVQQGYSKFVPNKWHVWTIDLVIARYTICRTNKQAVDTSIPTTTDLLSCACMLAHDPHST
jgi:hypothetical protein